MNNIFSTIKLGKYQEIELDMRISAFEVFKRLYPYCRNIFLLESLGQEGKFNRFSYIGFDPSLVISAKDKAIMFNGKYQVVDNPYSLLRDIPQIKVDESGYRGGLVGYFSYEATKYFEPAFAGFENREFPDFQFGFYLDGFIFDKKGQKCSYFYYDKPRLNKILPLIQRPNRLGDFSIKILSAGADKRKHKSQVLEAQEKIKAGEIFQVVISRKTHLQILGDKRRLYASLAQINPSPYMMYFKFQDREIISASPELLIRVKGDQIEHFGTLAGTIRRGKNKNEDSSLAEKLLSDEKEKAEHMMLVDLARNDLGRICDFGSIRVDKLASIKRYSHVQHIYSEIRGRLKNRENAFSSLAACFPAGTLTGAPKIEAMKIISQLEGEPRGPYGGVGGYFSLNGDAMLAIIIRSIFTYGEYAYTQTGSGIVLDSKPAKEYQEISNKQKAMEEALRLAQGKPL